MLSLALASAQNRQRSPFSVLLRSPEMGDLTQQFGASMRFHAALPKRVVETEIIVVARYWTAQFEWTAHNRVALQAGLSPAFVDAIANPLP
jgi:4-carboxymuconolactone decarboxylase